MKPVVIAGAGVAGLALAQALKKRGIPFRIFERDASLDTRRQGYRFHILPAGVDVLPSILTPAMQARLHACAAINENSDLLPSGFWDPLLGQRADLGSPNEPGRPQPPPQQAGEHRQALSLDRSVLRGLLSQGLDIEWNSRLESFEILPDGVSVRFSNHPEVEGYLLVGADGASSQVRKHLVADYELLDTKGRWFWGKTAITEDLLQKIEPDLTRGLHVITDHSNPKAPMTLLQEFIRFEDSEYRSALPQDYVYWVLQANAAHFGMDDLELLRLEPEACVEQSRQLIAHWTESMRAAVDLQNVAAAAVHPITSAKPRIVEWEGQGKVTLMGDAVHSMPPTAAAGATTALLDAAKIAEALEGCGGDARVILDYEDQMRKYAEENIRNCEMRSKLLFGMSPLDTLKPFTG